LPTFTDLFYYGPQAQGNVNLQPEKAWTGETGFKFGDKSLTGNISYFHRWGRNIIDYVMYPNGTWYAVNYPILNTNGLEIAANTHPQELFGKDFFIEQVILSLSFTSISKSADTVRSNYALDNLKYKIALGFNHRIYKHIEASWQFSFQKRNGNYGKFDTIPNLITKMPFTITDTPYPAFILLDGKIFYQYKLLNIFIEATNILNRYYFDLGNIPQPGRWVKAGIEVNIR
jgi:iron complex outermembrane receptor protein